MEYLTKSPSQTKKLGEGLAKKILKACSKESATILGLEGNLGSGKTTFLQGFAMGLGIKEKILSPTFVILKRFKVLDFRFKNFYHIDCYRIQKPKELLNLGFKEIVKKPANIIAVEWSERIKQILPKNTLSVKFEILAKKERKITITVLK